MTNYFDFDQFTGRHNRLAVIVGVVLLFLLSGAWEMASSPRLIAAEQVAIEFTAAEQAEIDDFCAEHGRNVKAADAEGLTLLHKAAASEDIAVAVLKYLVSKGADVHAKDNDGNTPLHEAAFNNPNVEVARFLVSQGADVNAKGLVDWTPLHMAALIGNVRVAKFLVSQGANLNAKDGTNMTPLHWAAFKSHVEVVACLVARGADVKAKDTTIGHTPLHLAAQFIPNVELVKFIVSKGADVKAKDNDGATPLDLARKIQNTAIVRCLSGLADTIPTPPSYGTEYTAEEKIEIDEFCAVHGTDAKAADENERGMTLLHKAAMFIPNVGVVKFLVSKGADVKATDEKYGFTPLHIAALMNPNVEVAKFLVSQGADIKAKAKNGATPLDIAREKENTAVIEYLSGLADTTATPPHSDTEFRLSPESKIPVRLCQYTGKMGLQHS